MPNIVSDASDKLVQVTGNELKVLSDADLDAVAGGVTNYYYNEEFGNIAIGFGTGFAPNNGVSIGIGQINIGDVDVDIIYPHA